jgi:hypothetical protein
MSTVIVNAHNRQQCNVFDGAERLSKVDTSLVGEAETFTDSQ